MSNLKLALIFAAVLTNFSAKANGLLEVVSPADSGISKMEYFQHSAIPKESGYQVGQSLIGHLHFLESEASHFTNLCEPLSEEFARNMTLVERDPGDYEDESAMI